MFLAIIWNMPYLNEHNLWPFWQTRFYKQEYRITLKVIIIYQDVRSIKRSYISLFLNRQNNCNSFQVYSLSFVLQLIEEPDTFRSYWNCFYISLFLFLNNNYLLNHVQHAYVFSPCLLTPWILIIVVLSNISFDTIVTWRIWRV